MVSARPKTLGRRSATSAAAAPSLRKMARNLKWHFQPNIFREHNALRHVLTSKQASRSRLYLQAVLKAAADPLEWLPHLTHGASPANMQGMAHSFLIFDFGGDEDTAQQARHRIDAWKQGFRLDKKIQVKFERKETEEKTDDASGAEPKAAKSTAKGKSKPGAKSNTGGKTATEDNAAPADASQIRLIVRLDFSDHEKLSHQRWLDRIPTEEPFKGAKPQIVRTGAAEFKTTSALFDSLD